MKWLARGFATVLILGLGWWVWTYFHPGPEVLIQRQLDRLAEAASFEPGESLMARAMAARKVAEFFAPEVQMIIEPRGFWAETMTRDEIASQVGLVRSSQYVRSLRLKIFDPVITLGGDRKSAVVELTAHAESPGERHLLVQEMKVTMKEVDGRWVIKRAETVRTLNQSPSSRALGLALLP